MIALVAVAALVLTALTPQVANADGKLWLIPNTGGPGAGGHVLDTGTFDLMVQNRAAGNGDGTAHGVLLIFAVNDPALLTSATMTLPDGTTETIDAAALQAGIPTMPCSERTLPPHGIYPTPFTTMVLGDMAANEVMTVGVDISGDDGLMAHLDAVGLGYKETGQGTRCTDVTTPPGHDVTVLFDDGGDGGDGGDPDPPCNELTVDKVASATGAGLGDEIDYTITVTNTGTCDLTDVTLVEDIPIVDDDDGNPVAAFSIVTSDPDPTDQTDTELTWDLGALAAGDEVIITLTVTFDEALTDGSTVVNTACASAAELDDPVCDDASVDVGAVGGSAGGPGFWCNQIRFALEGRWNAQFTVDDLDAWLVEINDGSEIFDELWDTSSLDLARDLLCRPNQLDSAADRLARHALTLWFNVVSERIDPDQTLGELTAGSVDPPDDMDPDMTIGDALAGAEADIVAGADDQTLGLDAQLLDFINNAEADVPEPPEWGNARATLRRRLHWSRITS